MPRRFLFPAFAVWLTSLAGCGAGSAAVAVLAQSDPETPVPVVVRSLEVGLNAQDLRLSPVSVSFELTHAGGLTADVELCLVMPGGGGSSCTPLTLVGDGDLGGLGSAPGGRVHTKLWDFAADLPDGAGFTPDARIRVRVVEGGSTLSNGPIPLGNDAPALSGLTLPVGEAVGPVRLDFWLADSSSDLTSIQVEFDNLSDAAGYQPGTLLGESAGLATTPTGVGRTLFWDIQSDAPAQEFNVRLRLTPNDGISNGPALIGDLRVDNNLAPVAILNGSAFVASTDLRKGIVVPLDVIDEEGDAVQVVFQWTLPGGSFPALPSTAAELAPILDDPIMRRSLAIATERPILLTGRVGQVGATGLRLHGNDLERGLPLSRGIVGRSLGLLRQEMAPAPIASSWVTNDLLGPVAVLPLGDGRRALVLDQPGPGSWRLRPIHLGTGASETALVGAAAGSPTALAWDLTERPRGTEWVLVAHDDGGIWQVDRVALDTGIVTTLIVGSGSTSLGPIRGLAPLSPSGAVITVGASVVRLDWSNLGAPTEVVLADDLEGPWGIVEHPELLGKVLIAERDWVNPIGGLVEGRVMELDLTTLQRRAFSGPGSPPRPEAIALESHGRRLLAIADSDPLDGLQELHAIELEEGTSGSSYELADGFALPSGLSTGPHGLRIVALPLADDLALGGGLEQCRGIVALDPTGVDIDVDAPFDPLPIDGQAWQVELSGLYLPPDGPSGQTFVWNSDDLGGAGDVVLRAVPYDEERGLATDTGVPRTVSGGVDLSVSRIGGPGLTDGIAAVLVADLNRDGLDDIATANRDGDSVSVFYQPAQGDFPIAPDLTLTGIAIVLPLNGPVALAAADINNDGDADLVIVNRDNNNVVLYQQILAGTYLPELLALGGVLDPAAVAVGDLNGDGRVDLAVASSGSDRIAVYFQLLAGLYGLVPDLYLGDGDSAAPEDVALADLDGDGDLDIVAAERDANRVTVFEQTAPGVFAPAPSVAIGGVLELSGPTSIFIGDVDADGDLDIACANETGNDLAVFCRAPDGTYPTAPTYRLAGAPSPVGPRSVLGGDIDGDGRIEILSANTGGSLALYDFVSEATGFRPQPTFVDSPVGPLDLAMGELGGGPALDLVVADSADDSVMILLAAPLGEFQTNLSDRLVLGGSQVTAQPSDLAIGDLDSDGDLDLAVSSEGGDSIAVFHQLGPGVFGAAPGSVLGGPGSTPAPVSLAAADINGDGAVDVACVHGTGVALFFQQAPGGFETSPDVQLGVGDLVDPRRVVIADIDRDGQPDIVVGDLDRIAIFLQSPAGLFPASASLSVGGPILIDDLSSVLVGDIDADGDADLACASLGGDIIQVFLQDNGSFLPMPTSILGSPILTPDPMALVLVDLDGDRDLDLACVNRSGGTLTGFMQVGPGLFPPAPSFILAGPTLQSPSSLTVFDYEGDGDADLAVGCDGTDQIVIARQRAPGEFQLVATALGQPGATDDPRGLTACDIDGDGDVDLVSTHPGLDATAVLFGNH